MPTLIPSNCSQDGTCAQRIQNALCSDEHDRHVILEAGGKVFPLLEQLRLLPWEQPEGSEQIPCYSSTNQTATILDGQGATLLMETQDELMGLLWARGVKTGLLLKNFTVATSRVPYTLASLMVPVEEMEGNTPGTAIVQVSDNDLYPPPCHLSSEKEDDHWLHHVKAITGWDRDHRRPSQAEYDWYVDVQAEWLECANANDETLKGMVRLHFPAPVENPHLPTEPHSILLRHDIYGHHVFQIELSENLQMQDIWIQSGAGMALATDQIQKGITLERVKVQPDVALGHTFSVAADGFHLGATRGGDVLIDGCQVQSQGDDGINMKSIYMVLKEWSGNQIYFTFEEDSIFTWRLWEGDQVSFYRRTTFEPLFTTRVVSKMEFDSNQTGVLVLEQDIPSTVEEFDLVVNDNTFADSVTIANSLFGNNRARGGLLENDNLLVVNTTFEHTTGPAIQVVPGCIPGGFCEGHVVRSNWTVENCTFHSNDFWNWSDAVIYIGAEVPVLDEEGQPTDSSLQLTNGTQHQDVTIRNCLFHIDNANSSSCFDKASFIGYGIDGLVLEGNQGCDNFTIASNCINVRVQGPNENESFLMTASKTDTGMSDNAAITTKVSPPEKSRAQTKSHSELHVSAAVGAEFPLPLSWWIIPVLLSLKLFR